jgi:hypothetical protein
MLGALSRSASVLSRILHLGVVNIKHRLVLGVDAFTILAPLKLDVILVSASHSARQLKVVTCLVCDILRDHIDFQQAYNVSHIPLIYNT